MRVIDYDVASLILTLYGVSSVSASEAVKRSNYALRRSSVEVCCRCGIKGIGNIVRSGNAQMHFAERYSVMNDLK